MSTWSATVYRAQDIITKWVVAIKLERIDNPGCHLEHKYKILNQLYGGKGMPQPLWFGREGSYWAMVLENLGPSLDKLIQASPDGALGLGHVAELGLQMVSNEHSLTRICLTHCRYPVMNISIPITSFIVISNPRTSSWALRNPRVLLFLSTLALQSSTAIHCHISTPL